MHLICKNQTVLWIVLALSGCTLYNARNMQKPKAELATIEVKSTDGKGTLLLFGIRVENPNPFPLKVDSVQYEVEIAGRKLAEEKIAQPTEVAAKSTAIVQLPMRLKFADLFSSIGELLRNDFAAYRLKGSAQVGLFNLPFDESGQFKIENGMITHIKK